MRPLPEPSSRRAFGPFEFDPVAGDLRKHGHRIRLAGQPLQILSALLLRPGELVSRETLQRQLWADSTHVDFDQGLNAAVNKLRQALSDSADQPRYIETLPGRGYRFMAPMVPAAPAKPVLAFSAPTFLPRRVSAQLALAALVVAALAGFFLGRRQTAASPALRPARFAVSPPAGFNFESGVSRQTFALSPDGTRLAFTAADASGASHLFVRELNGLEPRLLPETAGTHTVFWPPDGRSLFASIQGQLRRVALDNSPQITLGDAPSFLFSGAWLRPDRLILSSNHGSYFGSPSGGTPEPSKDSFPWPQILPGGENILYTVWDPKVNRFRAHVRPLDGGTLAPLLESDSRVAYTASSLTPQTGYLLYVRAGTLLAHPFDPRSLRLSGEAVSVASKVYSFLPTGAADFSVSDQGTLAYTTLVGRSQITWVDRQGRPLSTIGPANAPVKAGRLSPDGKSFALALYDVERAAQNLWIYDTQSNAGRQLTLAPGVRDSAVWSPDGKKLAHLYGFDGMPPRLAIRGLAESEPVELLPSGGFQTPTDWSSDGRFIAFANNGFPRFANEDQGDILLADLHQKGKIIPLLSSRFHEANASFSPDAKWLAFTSNESGRSELYLQAFEGGESPHLVGPRHRASERGARAVRWRRDGRELFYLGFDGRVHSIAVTPGPAPKFGPPQPLFAVAPAAFAATHSIVGFEVSPDGQRFAIPIVNPAIDGTSIVVVQNWEASLRP
ncbi:MAG: winged helix-turn-helix domain-containing protein [Acidobacteria bacterium]|nr:winged helix-turn-helix domain-containing protein [Acidobacteriota bacterium]